jgi:hypothetical protein
VAVKLGDMPEDLEPETFTSNALGITIALPAPEKTLAASDDLPLSNLTASDQLGSLVDMSLGKLREILSWPTVNPTCKMEIENVKLQLAAITQTLGAQLRVDDNRLKKQNVDMLPKLLAELREHEKRQVIVDVAAHQIQGP